MRKRIFRFARFSALGGVGVQYVASKIATTLILALPTYWATKKALHS